MRKGSFNFHLTDTDPMPVAYRSDTGTVWLEFDGLVFFAESSDALGFEQLYEWAHSLAKAVDAARLDWIESLPYNRGCYELSQIVGDERREND